MAIRDSNRGEYDWKSRTYRLENEVSNCISHYKNFIDAKNSACQIPENEAMRCFDFYSSSSGSSALW